MTNPLSACPKGNASNALQHASPSPTPAAAHTAIADDQHTFQLTANTPMIASNALQRCSMHYLTRLQQKQDTAKPLVHVAMIAAAWFT
jgi:hypothetical protein